MFKTRVGARKLGYELAAETALWLYLYLYDLGKTIMSDQYEYIYRCGINLYRTEIDLMISLAMQRE